MKFPTLLGARGGHLTHFWSVRCKWNLLVGFWGGNPQAVHDWKTLAAGVNLPLLGLAGATAATLRP